MHRHKWVLIESGGHCKKPLCTEPITVLGRKCECGKKQIVNPYDWDPLSLIFPYITVCDERFRVETQRG